jgi:hypothetical protein
MTPPRKSKHALYKPHVTLTCTIPDCTASKTGKATTPTRKRRLMDAMVKAGWRWWGEWYCPSHLSLAPVIQEWQKSNEQSGQE